MTAATRSALIVELLGEAGCRQAVVTDGARTAAILADGVLRWQAPPLVDTVRDVTGAGDTLAAVATHAILHGRTFLQAARVGMVAASHHVAERPVGEFTLPSLEAEAARLPPASAHRPEEMEPFG